MRINFGFFGMGRCGRIFDMTRMSIPFADPARSLLTTCQIYVLMRTRTSVTANKALMNSERYRIIAASMHLQLRVWQRTCGWQNMGIDTQRIVCICSYVDLPEVYMSAYLRHAYLRISWRREYHRPNEV